MSRTSTASPPAFIGPTSHTSGMSTIGEEVFAVLDGKVDMHYRVDGKEHVVALGVGDVFFVGLGCEHVAHPQGAARTLVVEAEGSVRVFRRHRLASIGVC